MLFINGLLQLSTEYTVTSSLLTVPGTLNVRPGDEVCFLY